MARIKNNPTLVQELIDKRWDMDDEEFEQKYNSLNLDDMCRVSEVIDGMETELTEEHGEKYFKACPNCDGTMYWDEFWECNNCGEEIYTDEDDNDGIIEY